MFHLPYLIPPLDMQIQPDLIEVVDEEGSLEDGELAYRSWWLWN